MLNQAADIKTQFKKNDIGMKVRGKDTSKRSACAARSEPFYQNLLTNYPLLDARRELAFCWGNEVFGWGGAQATFQTFFGSLGVGGN